MKLSHLTIDNRDSLPIINIQKYLASKLFAEYINCHC